MAEILVTGGAGFLGSHIADALSDRGHSVVIFDKKKSPWIRKDQEQITGDIDNLDSVSDAVKGKSIVYHLAALADLDEANQKPVDTVKTNILGTVNLLKACKEHAVDRFIFGSTVYVYSRDGGFYRCSKQACENYIEEFHLQYHLNYTILRYGSLYGTRTNNTNGVYRLMYQYMNQKMIRYPGSSNDKREYIHVLDAAKLSARVIEDESFKNRHFILTGNDRLSIAELFTMFREILDRNTEVQYEGDERNATGHYSITPYTFTPKLGHKLTSNEYVDMGQGLIELINEIYQSANNQIPK